MYAFAHRLHEPVELDALKIVFTHPSYIKKLEEQQQEFGVSSAGFSIQDNQLLALKGDTIISENLRKYLRYFLRRVPEECIRFVVYIPSIVFSLLN